MTSPNIVGALHGQQRPLCAYGIPHEHAEYINSIAPRDVISIRENPEDGKRYALRRDFKAAFDACCAVDPDTKIFINHIDEEGNIFRSLNPAVLRVMVRTKMQSAFFRTFAPYYKVLPGFLSKAFV